MAKTKDAAEIIRKEFGGAPDFEKQVAIERMHMRIAQMIYDARKAAGLTQTELAARVGTSQPAIARLESADYYGHSLDLVARIALVLETRLDISLSPAEPSEPKHPSPRKAAPKRASNLLRIGLAKKRIKTSA